MQNRSAMRWAIVILTALISAQPFSFDRDHDAMIQIGLLAEALVVANVSEADAALMVQRLDDATAERQALQAAEAALHDAVREVSIASELLRADPDNIELQQNHEEALASSQNAISALHAARELLADFVFAGLLPEQLMRINRYHTTRQYRVPAWFRVLQRGDDEWRRIEKALRLEIRCARNDLPMPPEEASMLLGIRSNPEVVWAGTLIENHLSSMRTLLLTEE